MRGSLALIVLMAAAGCTPPPPVEQGGVGFGDYNAYLRAREAEAAASRTVSVQAPVAPYDPYAAPMDGAPTAEELARAGITGAASLPQVAVQGGAAGLPAQPVSPSAPEVASVAPVVSHGGISDEQDFQAVATRETIESDKERLERNRALYQQVQPGELPQRPREDTALIVEYAVKAPNRLGESIYPRSSLALTSHERACARYPNPEAAQEAFLKSGGPTRDPKNLDPDGDGFACSWDPTPFQTVRN